MAAAALATFYISAGGLSLLGLVLCCVGWLVFRRRRQQKTSTLAPHARHEARRLRREYTRLSYAFDRSSRRLDLQTQRAGGATHAYHNDAGTSVLRVDSSVPVVDQGWGSRLDSSVPVVDQGWGSRLATVAEESITEGAAVAAAGHAPGPSEACVPSPLTTLGTLHLVDAKANVPGRQLSSVLTPRERTHRLATRRTVLGDQLETVALKLTAAETVAMEASGCCGCAGTLVARWNGVMRECHRWLRARSPCLLRWGLSVPLGVLAYARMGTPTHLPTYPPTHAPHILALQAPHCALIHPQWSRPTALCWADQWAAASTRVSIRLILFYLDLAADGLVAYQVQIRISTEPQMSPSVPE